MLELCLYRNQPAVVYVLYVIMVYGNVMPCELASGQCQWLCWIQENNFEITFLKPDYPLKQVEGGWLTPEILLSTGGAVVELVGLLQLER